MTMQDAKTIAVVQARMKSTRLPGKTLADLQGQPMLARIVKQLAQASMVERAILATTCDADDDCIAELAIRLGIECHRGHPTDCLDRVYQAICQYSPKVVVRLTADNPLVDGGFIDDAIIQFGEASAPADLLSSAICDNLPTGLSVEVMAMSALAAAWKNETDPLAREHVTTHILRNSDKFAVIPMRIPEAALAHMRWTVDVQEDLVFVRAVYRHLPDANNFTWRQIADILSNNPQLLAINAHVRQRVV